MVLPVSKVEIKFKLLTGKEETMMDEELKSLETDADKFAQDTAKGIEKKGDVGEIVPGAKGMPGTGLGEDKTEELPDTDVSPGIVGETEQQAIDLQDAAAGAGRGSCGATPQKPRPPPPPWPPRPRGRQGCSGFEDEGHGGP